MRVLLRGILRIAPYGAVALIAGCATAPIPMGVIHGTVAVPASRSSKAAAARAPQEAVVYLEAIPAPPPPPKKSAAKQSKPAAATAPVTRHPRSTLAFETRGFAPRVVPVTRGDSVAFVNRDRRFHSAFSVSPPKKFDLGSLRPGATRLAKFDRTGVVRVFCKLHTDSSAFVFVAPTPVWVRPDATGAFALPPLPPGTYDLRVWHPVYGERRRKVELPPAGAAVAFDY